MWICGYVDNIAYYITPVGILSIEYISNWNTMFCIPIGILGFMKMVILLSLASLL
jgi:hypothetical protein